MNSLRRLALDYALWHFSDHRPRPARFAARRGPSLVGPFWHDLQAFGPLGQRGRLSGVRASDADREEVVASLKGHYAEGRLTTDELTACVESADCARSLGDLAALTRDLPEMSSSTAPSARPQQMTRPVVGLAALGLSAFLLVALTSLMPAEMWALLLMFLVPLATFALFAVLPLALLAIPLLWVLRGPCGPT